MNNVSKRGLDGGSEKLQPQANADNNHVVKLSVVFDELAKLAIITLDTDPANKVMNIPVGKFVRLDDVRSVMQKHVNSSLAVR